MTQSVTPAQGGGTSVKKTQLTKRNERPWHPQDQGGDCRNDRVNDWVPPLFNEDAYTPVPSFVVNTCGRCPFVTECLEWAMKNDAYGFWGGTSRYQRLQLAKEQHRVKCPGCSSTSVVQIDRSEICLGCGISWSI